MTETTDYSLTEQLNVSVNAGMNIEGLGDLGMSVSADIAEVRSKNTTETTEHNTSFTLKVPPGEGRRVTEQTIETTSRTIFECKVGVTGILTIIWAKPDHPGTWVSCAPDAHSGSEGRTASGVVTRTVKSTHMTVTVDRIDKTGRITDPRDTRAAIISAEASELRRLGRSLNSVWSIRGDRTLTNLTKHTPYSITFVESQNPANRDHEFRSFQNEVHLKFVSKPGSIRLDSTSASGNKWSSGISWDPSVWPSTSIVKNKIVQASHETEWGDGTYVQLKFLH